MQGLSEASTGSKKMLNLITGQVTYRTKPVVTCTKNGSPSTLKEIIHKYLSKEIYSNVTSKQRDTISINDFITEAETNENYYIL